MHYVGGSCEASSVEDNGVALARVLPRVLWTRPNSWDRQVEEFTLRLYDWKVTPFARATSMDAFNLLAGVPASVHHPLRTSYVMVPSSI